MEVARKIGFWEPVDFGPNKNLSEVMIENIDSYFCIDFSVSAEGNRYRKVYRVLPLQVRPEITLVKEGDLHDNVSSCWFTALKVVSYCTVLLPLLALAAKVFLRTSYNFSEMVRVEAPTKTGQIGLKRELWEEAIRGMAVIRGDIRYYATMGKPFNLEKCPSLTFRVEAQKGAILEEYERMTRAQAWIEALGYDKDVQIPRAQIFNIERGGVVVSVLAQEDVSGSYDLKKGSWQKQLCKLLNVLREAKIPPICAKNLRVFIGGTIAVLGFREKGEGEAGIETLLET